VGVKMAQEIKFRPRVPGIDYPVEISIPTEDYKTPDPKQLKAGLKQAVKQILNGRPVYVGCMGGRGRTGLFMAVLAKAFGVANPVEYVRANYYHHAVETKPQYQFVTDFKIPYTVRAAIAVARFTAMFKRNRTQLTVIVV
jgi:hypothetical protein